MSVASAEDTAEDKTVSAEDKTASAEDTAEDRPDSVLDHGPPGVYNIIFPLVNYNFMYE